ncbi:MAG: hypothetical protein JGK38_23930 [Microcoleus sp. PH2017_15_JOR_U_A]|uniref:hypothetical protein n=1 Tax=unclassified Microcoleus TaxID=2642155 RepID=UPI001E07CD18|nr:MULTISPECIES: hypothetical protein [unclassified Microcoleus]MCC3473309.1 hypothetical protein [Microcoleus sp. PH2017_13_LAR_U_A]MCC3486525.1 hypothetical protein [Microcoleus sp. PH2017_14_LAR_D_A]MCC3499607.1 hypothetical protein [Microcoleus sp. PH2017_15_JOR_U_A]MCC3600178.1 hypothetical protein [Microcoleus sp. PH2017_26_ELK_O_A]MCC3623167.1 hypothetical protein [Microcoleus sp. PH2017_36_ELK_O_B]
MEKDSVVQQGLTNSLSLIIVIGDDVSGSEREELIKKAHISSLAVKDFVQGELDLESFLDIQEYCLTEDSIDNYINTVNANIENLSFAELLTT